MLQEWNTTLGYLDDIIETGNAKTNAMGECE